MKFFKRTERSEPLGRNVLGKLGAHRYDHLHAVHSHNSAAASTLKSNNLPKYGPINDSMQTSHELDASLFDASKRAIKLKKSDTSATEKSQGAEREPHEIITSETHLKFDESRIGSYKSGWNSNENYENNYDIDDRTQNLIDELSTTFYPELNSIVLNKSIILDINGKKPDILPMYDSEAQITQITTTILKIDESDNNPLSSTHLKNLSTHKNKSAEKPVLPMTTFEKQAYDFRSRLEGNNGFNDFLKMLENAKIGFFRRSE
ncbi:unnamed protein product [Dracunculus medinensis]|uniref:Uncharacterized protein n=1 Tax=Dracunculus medinensis TaxID=318479 RepID=A0A0N4UKV6_DRAME|nr:unnamed protein product [Dracunculus medinensis]